MAMVNCAFELAKMERRVLLVDFDLEAPGVNAFLDSYGKRKCKGLVDFVTDYRETRKAPHIREYIYEVGPSGARLNVMPAGRRDETYANRLHKIDWGQLYAEEDGYLLFEDMKLQWKEVVSPDYVFIDSRTGHTDVSGICTRQLPDSVVLLFRMDQQNLEGLRPIVSAIRNEVKGPRKKNIYLHFVPSNVPDIDDEDLILKRQLGLFRDQLQLNRDCMKLMIRHYDSLTMLEHKVFTLERENSRLSKEYQELANNVIRQNPKDLEGAKDFLATKLHRFSHQSDVFDQVDRIADNHGHDPSILRLLVRFHKHEGNFHKAIEFLSELIVANRATVENYVRRAELYLIVGDDESVKDDLHSALSYPAEKLNWVFRLFSMIREKVPALLDDIPHSTVLRSLPLEDQVRLAEIVVSKSGAARVSIKILKEIIQNGSSNPAAVTRATHVLGLLLIFEGAFDEAIEILVDPENIEDVFNLAMAKWGETGEIPVELFKRVQDYDETDAVKSNERGANYEFCLALTAWALHDDESSAQIRLHNAHDCLRHHAVTFSPWRYQEIDSDEYRLDLEEAAQMFKGAEVKPIVFRQTDWYKETANA